MTNYTSIKVSSKQAESIALDYYGLRGTAEALPGEVDFNFRINTHDGESYVLKVSRPDFDEAYSNYQEALLKHLSKYSDHNIVPELVKNKKNKLNSEWSDSDGYIRKVHLLKWISGRVWSGVNPKSDELRLSLGRECGLITKALQGFQHSFAERELDWDIAHGLWTKEHLDLFDAEQKAIIEFFQNRFTELQPTYRKLRRAVIQNDANDNNIIVTKDLLKPQVKALIDYGDAVQSQIINDVAIACAYACMDLPDPLEAALAVVQGYHQTFPLQENELKHLYSAIAMRLVISLTKSAQNKLAEPDNEYLLISEKPAWALLKKWRHIGEEFASYSFRSVCDYNAHPNEERFYAWSKKNTFQLSDLFPSIGLNLVAPLDLSVASRWVGNERDFNNLKLFDFKINELQKRYPNKIIAGGYLEARALYLAPEYDRIGNHGRQSRTVHLGIDYWLPEITAVHAVITGEVVVAADNAGDKQYGGLVILKHVVKDSDGEDFCFFSLYGHLNVKSVMRLNVGQTIKQGERIANLGDK